MTVTGIGLWVGWDSPAMNAIMMSWPGPHGIHARAYVGSELLVGSGRCLYAISGWRGRRPNCCSRDSLDGKECMHPWQGMLRTSAVKVTSISRISLSFLSEKSESQTLQHEYRTINGRPRSLRYSGVVWNRHLLSMASMNMDVSECVCDMGHKQAAYRIFQYSEWPKLSKCGLERYLSKTAGIDRWAC